MRRFFTILIFSILLALLPVIAHALSYDQVSQIARDTIVLIDGCTSGSGVIYERKGNVYSILTAKHVVSQPNGCFVITPDKIRQRINPNIIPVSRIDLAVVQSTSNKNYKLAEFGNSAALTPGKTVYLAGSPEPSVAIPERTLLVTPGNIVGIQKPQNGYSLIYNNATRRGMSGGAVLNEEGKIVGIHGQGDEQDGSKVGLNLGIPIKLFLDSPKSISPPVAVKPSPKVSLSPVAKKPLPVTPKKIVVKESQTQSKPVNAKKYPYESLTVEKKQRIETCTYWLGNSWGNLGTIRIVTRLLIPLISGSWYWYYVLLESFGIKNKIIRIMVIIFLLGAFLFIRDKFIIIGFSIVNIGLFTFMLFGFDKGDTFARIIFLCFTIFWLITLFSIPLAEYIGNTYCPPFGYSYY